MTKAFTVIFLASVRIWFLQNFDVRLNVVADSSQSLLAMIGGWIAPILTPIGLGDWRIATALITGFTAKESVVSTLNVLLSGESLTQMFTPFSAVIFLVFSLLYTPCVAAIAAVKRELGRKNAVMLVILQCVIAWVVCFLIHGVGVLFVRC
jgi:ferrous iron transport protein B